MSLQLYKVCLYSHGGEHHALEFQLNRLNIITGSSKTGKSAILEIVEYCLGSSQFNMRGVFAEKVSWFSTIFVLNDTYITVAKPRPRHGKKSMSEAFLHVSTIPYVVPHSELTLNSTDAGIEQYLSSLLGIRSTPYIGRAKSQYTVHITHTTAYLFQDYSTVANKKLLFKGEENGFEAQAITNTLPYFLGVIPEDVVDKTMRIKRLRDAKRRLAVDLQNAKELQADRDNRLPSLEAEARESGLLQREAVYASPMDAIRVALQWQPEQYASPSSDTLRQLMSTVQAEAANLNDLIEQRSTLRQQLVDMQGYTDDVRKHRGRLEVIDIYPAESPTLNCPLCASGLSHAVPSATAIRERLEGLRHSVSGIQRDTTTLQDRYDEVVAQIDEANDRLTRKRQEVNNVIAVRNELRQLQDGTQQALRVQGKIAAVVEMLGSRENIAQMEARISRINTELTDLLSQVGDEAIESRMTSALNVIGKWMTDWAKRLPIEYRGFPHRLDYKRRTVVVDMPDSELAMIEMGASENALGCHIIALLALHKYFRVRQRPVPGFVMFDQPSQVYYSNASSPNEEPDDDAKGLDDFLSLLRDFDEDAKPTERTQIILLEHARRPQFGDYYRNSHWTVGNGFVPSHWPSA